MLTDPELRALETLKIPFVGVGCLVVHAGRLLMVCTHDGRWSPPGGHLDFGESPADCAARETREETGVRVTDMEFVALTNDLLPDTGKHYVTVWMRGEAADDALSIADTAEVAEAGWFPLDALPQPSFLYFENLLAGRCLPLHPPNLPFHLHDRQRGRPAI